MKNKCENIVKTASAEILNLSTERQIQDLKVKYLGKKGEIKELLLALKDIDASKKGEYAKEINKAKTEIENLVQEKFIKFQEEKLQAELQREKIDVSLPVDDETIGSIHPISRITMELENIFISMGYELKKGPEIETVFNNFDALNADINHPSRSENDTFYFTNELLLRTQTSPVQIRTMLNENPPIRIISPGRCFRKDDIDATHSPMFHQIEGLVIDEGISMADLKGTLEAFVSRLFGKECKTRFRPHFFPFTEPSCEMDLSCFKCSSKGCRFCKNSGWIEILGCGMVDPKVLENCNIDSRKYSGFAFGMGIDRICMLKYEIDDIRLLFENDKRFLEQF